MEEWSLNVGGVSSVVWNRHDRARGRHVVEVVVLADDVYPVSLVREDGGHDEQLPVVDPPVPSPGSASRDESPGSWHALTVSLFAVSAMILLAVVFPAETST